MGQPQHSVLIVEDNPDWQLTLQGLLQDGGFSVDVVGSREDARLALRKNQYDIALLDIRLDERDENDDEGLALAEEINQRWPKIQIFITTGYANEDYVKRAMKPHTPGGGRLAKNFIKKSDTDRLVDILKQALK